MIKKSKKEYVFNEKKFKKSSHDAFNQDDRKDFVEYIKSLAKK